MSCVEIAMAAYNGERYIAEQIESIIAQTEKNWRLFIRDDGSKDNTIKIIREYVAKDSRIVLIDDSLGNLGVSANFEVVLSYCSAAYIMLADQDDVWFPDKIEKSLHFIKQVEKNKKPILVFSNSILTNSDISKKWGNNYSSYIYPSFTSFIFSNAGYQGSGMIFNAALKENVFPFLGKSKVHDYHISLTALWFGKVFFLSEPLMYYRRHENTTTLSNVTIFQRIKSFFKQSSLLYDPDLRDYLYRLYRFKETFLSSNQKKEIRAYLRITSSDVALWKKIQLVFIHNFTLRSSHMYLIIKILLVKEKR